MDTGDLDRWWAGLDEVRRTGLLELAPRQPIPAELLDHVPAHWTWTIDEGWSVESSEPLVAKRILSSGVHDFVDGKRPSPR